MQLSEDEIIQKFPEKFGHCQQNMLPPYEYVFTCISCGYNVIKRKHQLSEIQRKKINFSNRFNHEEQKIICLCREV